MGAMDVNPVVFAETSGKDLLKAVREAGSSSFDVPGNGPTGARSRSQSSQSEVTEGLGLGHWGISFEPPTAAVA
jgi:hypothetical protein